MKKLKKPPAIIAELMGNSHFRPLKKMFFARDFLRTMNPAHQVLISKILIKKDTLMILTKHALGYQELNHDDTKKSIKILIKIYAKAHPFSEFSQIKTLKIFTDRHFAPPAKKVKKKQKSYFLELSKGEFKNPFKSPILHEKFEKIRQAIKNDKQK